MKITIIGAGELGQLLAERLCAARHDVVVVDSSRNGFDYIRNKLDVMVMQGDATNIALMKRACEPGTELLLAVSGDQASNMTACLLARQLGVKKTICRIYSENSFSEEDGVTPALFGIDHVVSSARECARRVCGVLRHPAVLDDIDFFNRQAAMVAIRIPQDSPLTGKKLEELPDKELLSSIRFAALVRRRRLRTPNGKTSLEAGDCVYVAGSRDAVERFLNSLEQSDAPTSRRVVIAGATLLGEYVAKEALSQGMEVTLVTRDEEQGNDFIERVSQQVRVIIGDCTDKDVLVEAGVPGCEVFVGAEDDDEIGILGCIVANRLGAQKVVAVTHKPEYMDIVPEMEVIDCGFNATVVAVNTVFRQMGAQFPCVDSRLHGFQAYLAEFAVQPKSRLNGRQVKDAGLPSAAVLAMVIRGNAVLAPSGGMTLQVGDVVVAIVTSESEELLKPFFIS